MRSAWEQRSDAELLATPLDPEAFAAFYRRHVRAVISQATAMLPAAQAADVVAEVFATALVHSGRYDPARGSAAAWLGGIARNKIADARRRGQTQTRLCQRLRIEVPHLHSQPLLDGSSELLDALPVEQRTAVRARVIDDKSYGQIALEHGISPAAARQRVSRGLRLLRSRERPRGTPATRDESRPKYRAAGGDKAP